MIKISLDHNRIAETKSRIQEGVQKAKTRAVEACTPVAQRLKNDALTRVATYKEKVKAVFSSRS